MKIEVAVKEILEQGGHRGWDVKSEIFDAGGAVGVKIERDGQRHAVRGPISAEPNEIAGILIDWIENGTRTR